MIHALDGSDHGFVCNINKLLLVLLLLLPINLTFSRFLKRNKIIVYNSFFYFYFTESQEVVKPKFIAEPNDEYVQSNSSVSLLCEARFVFKLEINCSGGLVPDTWLKSEDENNKTLLIVDVSHTKMKARKLARVSCVCYATGYKGSVLKSQPALVALACKM